MAVVSLLRYRPSPRFDGNPWTKAIVEEAPDTADGPGAFADVEEFTLSPVDADPAQPLTRNFTTTQATAESGYWYRMRFEDAAGNAQTSVPAFNGLDSGAIPTAAEIREESNVEWAEYGYPTPTGGEADRLDPVLATAVTEFQAMTGVDPTDAEGMSTDKRVQLIRKAIRMLVEYDAGASQMEVVESVVDFDVIASFGAAGYNETRRNVSANAQVVHPWPALNRLLKFIVYFDNTGESTFDTPEVYRPGLEPRPGEWVMDDLPFGPFGMFDPPLLPDLARTVYGTGP